MRRCIAALLLLGILTFSAVAAHGAAPLLTDCADLLTIGEEQVVLTALEQTRQTLNMDVVVVTVDSLEGKSARVYADDWYDYNGYGLNGVLLLVSMGTREWYISTSGSAIQGITDREVSQMGARLEEYLAEGAYQEAFLWFARQVTVCGTGAGTETSSGVTGWLICIGIGIVIGFISVMVMKGKMKTVRSQTVASDYVTNSAIAPGQCRDIFLYSHVSRTQKAQSSTHSGSSGRSHGGGGGRF